MKTTIKDNNDKDINDKYAFVTTMINSALHLCLCVVLDYIDEKRKLFHSYNNGKIIYGKDCIL